jgi:diadenosine tetraphosphate (Ap4A) HIT family hydrolase
VYEDEHFTVLLTIHPINPGHLMVVTNAHIPSFYDVEDTLYTSMMLLVKRMALAVKAVYNPLQVVMETSGAGNRHVHIHVLPVYSLYDLVPRDVQERQRARPATDAELTLILHDLRRYLHA